jgi:protein CrcB
LLVFAFIVSLVLVIVLPISLDKSWIFLTYTAVFGILGAYLRYFLSFLNPRFKDFPFGTFIANILGTWILAMLTLLSKFEVSYSNHPVMAVIFGLSYGFCGNLTTISTFVNELNNLKRRAGYIYGLTSTAVAQIGIILILNIYQKQQIRDIEIMPKPINLCESYEYLCNRFLAYSGCPK